MFCMKIGKNSSGTLALLKMASGDYFLEKSTVHAKRRKWPDKTRSDMSKT